MNLTRHQLARLRWAEDSRARARGGFIGTLLLYAAFFVVSELLRPKPKLESAKPAGLGDFQFPTATEGRSVPLLWGTIQIAGPNVVWYGDLEQVPITEKVKTGMFSSENVVIGFQYYVGIQFALCRGTVNELRAIWIGDDKIYSGTVADGGTVSIDEPKLFGGKKSNGGVVGTFRFHAGSQSQAVNPYLSSKSVVSATVGSGGSGYSVGQVLTVVGGTFTTAATFEVTTVSVGAVTGVNLLSGGTYTAAPSNPAATTDTGTGCTLNLTFSAPLQSAGGDTPAYRGTSYGVFEKGYVGNSTSIKPWKFEVRRIPTGPATGANESVNGTLDANPVNVIYEIMTDKDWGLGFDTTDIDTSSFSAAGVTLKAEGNGYSFLLDSPTGAVDLIKEVERQIDGIVFYDMSTGKWKVSLARGGYDINTVPELTPTNVVELKDFSRGSWEDTTNQVRVQFNDRADSYKTTYALAQDMANVRLQNGVNVNAQVSFPGVKDKTLANQIVWRQLRSLSYPLVKASLVVDRTFFGVQPAQVLALTDVDLGITKLPVRVTKIDFGELEDNRITLDVVQDVFYYQVGSFGDPPGSSWAPPADSLLPFDSDKQMVFEAPRGFITRDPDSAGIVDKVWCGARRKGVEVSFLIHERHSAGSPSGAFAPAGESFGLLLIGVLNSTLAAGTAFPTTSVVVVPAPDTQAALESAFVDGATLSDVGTNLVNLVLVGSEFMLVAGGAQTSGANVQLNSVYRGVLDSVQATHPAGTKVWLLFVGGALTSTTFVGTNNVDIKLLPESNTDTVLEGDATTVSLTMANRVRRPYAPSFLRLGGTLFASTIALEQVGSGGETYGFAVVVNRRDYRATDEIPGLTADAATLAADFPAANSTTHDFDVRSDPAGANTFLYTTVGVAGATFTVLRVDVLLATDGVLPTSLRLAIRAQHTDTGVVYPSRQDLVWDFAATSGLTGQFNFGALDTNDVSNLYTATVAGTYNFTLSSSFSSGSVEYRINAGAWLPLITAGNTTGSIPAIVLTNTIEIRHTSSVGGSKKHLDMDAPGAGQDGYAVLFV